MLMSIRFSYIGKIHENVYRILDAPMLSFWEVFTFYKGDFRLQIFPDLLFWGGRFAPLFQPPGYAHEISPWGDKLPQPRGRSSGRRFMFQANICFIRGKQVTKSFIMETKLQE